MLSLDAHPTLGRYAEAIRRQIKYPHVPRTRPEVKVKVKIVARPPVAPLLKPQPKRRSLSVVEASAKIRRTSVRLKKLYVIQSRQKDEWLRAPAGSDMRKRVEATQARCEAEIERQKSVIERCGQVLAARGEGS